MSRYESGEYSQANPTWHVGDSSWKAGQILRMIDQNDLQLTSVCEIGCGAGEILAQLHERMPKVARFQGYEVSPQAYELCQTRSRDRLEFTLSDITGLDGGYDLALAIDVIEHIEDCYTFLRAIRKVATYKIFHIPLDMSVQKVLRRRSIMHLRDSVGHVHYFMKDTALAMLRECGYEVDDVFYTAGDIDLPPQSSLARMARIPRQLMFSWNQDMAAQILGGFSLMVLAR